MRSSRLLWTLVLSGMMFLYGEHYAQGDHSRSVAGQHSAWLSRDPWADKTSVTVA